MRESDSVFRFIEDLLSPPKLGFLLPLIPGGIVVFSFPLIRPDLADLLSTYPNLLGHFTVPTIVCFLVIVVGMCICALYYALAELLGWSMGFLVDKGFASKRQASKLDDPREQSKDPDWRNVASTFIGDGLAPPMMTAEHKDLVKLRLQLLENIQDMDERSKRIRRLAERESTAKLVDLRWWTWYNVLTKYFERRPERFEFTDLFVTVLQLSGWASLIVLFNLPFSTPRLVWVVALIATVGGLLLSFAAIPIRYVQYLRPHNSETLLHAMLEELRKERSRCK
jgi:hypothetical protein